MPITGGGTTTTTSGGTTTTGTGVVGDPFILMNDGSRRYLNCKHGESYLFAGDDRVSVSFRVAEVENAPERTFIDRAVVLVPEHNVTVDLDKAWVDGKSWERTESPKSIGVGTVWHHVGVGGEDRVDVKVGDWRVAVIQDKGTSVELHGGGPLEGVPHLGIFLDDRPKEILRGVIL